MHKFLLLIVYLSLFPLITTQAQKEEIVVTGRMTDSQGEPIPGVNVFIKGTKTGTIADIDGNYKIKAPLGATLVFSFIGMKTQEAIVTRTGLNPKGTRKIIPYNRTKEIARYTREDDLADKRTAKGYKKRMNFYREYLADSLVLQQYERVNSSATSVSDRKFKRQRNRYTNSTNDAPYRLGKIVIDSRVSVEQVGKLPELQSTFSQGRPSNGELTYQGPETGEYFSWGPKLVNLEFDGTDYPYDKNGNLTHRGTGNGTPANNYDATRFLKTGYTASNAISIYQMLYDVKVDFSYRNQTNKGILPGEDLNKHTFNLKLEGIKDFDLNLNYTHQADNFQDGAFRSRLLSMMYLTPPSFDNQNALSAKEAQKQAGSIYTADGSIRSCSPGKLDNPYFLTQEATNPRETDSWRYKLNYTTAWNVGNINASAGGSNSFQTEELTFPGRTVSHPTGFTSKREETLANYFVASCLENNIARYNFRFFVPLRAEFYTRELTSEINQKDDLKISQDRQIVTANPLLQYQQDRDFFLVKAGSNIYSSSTADKSYFYPNISLYLKPFKFFEDVSYWSTYRVINNFKLAFNYVTQVNEYALNYQKGTSNSLQYRVDDFWRYTERDEIMVPENLAPELKTKWDFSVILNALNGRLSSDFSVFNTSIENSIFPLYENNYLTYKNIGEVETKGWEETLNFWSNGDYNSSLQWESTLVLSQITSNVKKLEMEGPISVAGFSDVQTALVEGEPVGVIMGNTFLRNDQGQMVIGPDGFPLVDDQLSVIGDPTPDLLIGFSNRFHLRGFTLGFSINATIGGDVWNGTQSTLDYYGASAHTERVRGVTDYIFDGVTLDGTVNNKLVDFAPREGQVNDNRWVRYGKAGVAEEYIEDGTRLLLKELYLSYQFNENDIKHLGLYSLSLSFFANNLFGFSNYEGIVPESTLWGHSNTSGLDYFNNPLIRSFGFSVNLSL